MLKKLGIELLYIYQAFITVFALATAYDIFINSDNIIDLSFAVIMGSISFLLLFRSLNKDVDNFLKEQYPHIYNKLKK